MQPRSKSLSKDSAPAAADWSDAPDRVPFAAKSNGIDAALKQRLKDHYDRVAETRSRFRRRNAYYYEELIRYLRFLIPQEKAVLEVGCGDGFLLRMLKPGRGLGLDLSPEMIRRAREASEAAASAVEFRVADIEREKVAETFDYVVCSDLLGGLLDIQQALENLGPAFDADSRLVLHYHGLLWEPLAKLAQRVGLKAPQPHHNWLNRNDIENLLTLAGFELVLFDRKILFPFRIPLLSPLLNRVFAALPGIRSLCLVHFIVARKMRVPAPLPYSTSIVIPCRNEKGTIRAAIERLPDFGQGQEIIFVDGHSTDGTPEEIEKVIREFPHKDIRLLRQQGRGKGDAVRLGFEAATKDVLMILDADLTVPPEDLPKFHHALATGKAEFANGSRLVYPMEKQAMRFLNILGNHFFSLALTWLLNQPLKDTLCGTKALFRKDYRKIKAARAYFGDFDPFGDFDLLFGAVKQSLKILEIPVRYRDRTYGTTNISRFRHGFLLLKMVAAGFFKLKW